jgi:hypothetical protein
MARGWESKSVEEQIDMAERHAAASAPKLSREEIETLRKRENLQLSRTRVIREMEATRNPRYKEVLTKALAELDNRIAAL